MAFRRLILRIVVVLGFIGFSAPAFAGGGADDFISELGEQAIKVLQGSANQEGRKTEFERLFTGYFDTDQIGRTALGRFWRQTTPEQQAEYQILFKRYIIDVYSTRFSGYSGQKFVVSGQKNVERGEILVSSQIVSQDGSPPINVDWRISNKSGYKITDVVVEGVSMLVTQRQEFSSIINGNGGKVEALLTLLRKKAGGK